MKSFKNFLLGEENTIASPNSDNSDSLTINVEHANNLIEKLLIKEYINPYIPLNAIADILMEYDIVLPANVLLKEESGEEVFSLEEGDLHLYFGYASNENGLYEVYAELTNSKGIDDLLKEEDDEDEKNEYFKITPSLLIRLMEVSREDLKDDISIHRIVDRMNEIGHDVVFCADHYADLMKK